MKFGSRVSAWLHRVPLARQLYGAFALVVVLAALLGAVALVALQQVSAQADALSSRWMVGVGHLAELRALLVESRDMEVKHSRTTDKSYHAEYEQKLGEVGKAMIERQAAFAALIDGDDARKRFEDFTKAAQSLAGFQKKVVEMGRAGQQQDAADVSDGASAMAFDESLGALTKLTQLSFAGGEAAARHVGQVRTQSLWAVGGLLGACLLLGAALAFAITRTLLAQLGGEPGAAVRVAKAVAEGDLSSSIVLKPGDTRSLLASLQAMQQALGAAVADVRRG
ncbi:MAG: MCP four helix bundle domain-containing protein, partial [Burkholderiaceae bacterium]